MTKTDETFFDRIREEAKARQKPAPTDIDERFNRTPATGETGNWNDLTRKKRGKSNDGNDKSN